MKKIIFDIMHHVSGLNNFDIIKITGTENGTEIHAHDGDRTVVLVGKLKEPLTTLSGSIGLSDGMFLKGIANLYDIDFAHDEEVTEKPKDNSTTTDYESEIDLKIDDKKSGAVPTGLIFKDNKGNGDTYGFVSPILLAELFDDDDRIFKEPTWDIEFDLTKDLNSKIRELTAKASVYKSIKEDKFTAQTKPDKNDPTKNNLIFNFGNVNSANTGYMTFKADVKASGKKDAAASMNQSKEWPSDKFLNLLTLGVGREKCKINFCKDICMITIESKYAIYKFVMLGGL